MNPQETQQVIAQDEKCVPAIEMVKISSTNFWYTIKKVKDSESYEFLLANKKCVVDAEVFRKILDICPRVEGEEFNEGMFYRENVDYPELILEDFAFQIDHKKERKSRHETMPFPRFTKDDVIVSILKFVRIREDYQEYGLPIPDMILNDAIKRSKSYQMFLKYSTGQIPPKKSRGKGSQGKKTTNTLVADVDVSEESDSEPARNRTASRRVVKKKVTISIADNIIFDLVVALELGKSISLTEAAEEEAARQVHATHARIVTESVSETTRRRPSGIAFRDTYQVSMKVSSDPSQRLKGTEGSSELTGSIPEVPDESTIVFATSSEGTGTKPGVPDEKEVTSEENVILEWGSKQESEYSKEDQGDDEEVDWIDFDDDEEKKDDTRDDKSIDLEMTDDEETDDEFVRGNEQVNDDEDEEMKYTEVEESRNGDAEISDAAKADVEKTEEVKDDAKKTKLPPTSSSLSVSSDHSVEALATLKSQVPMIVKHYLGSKIDDVLQKIKREQAEKLKMPKYTIKSTNKATLKEYDQKSALYQTMHENKSFNKNPSNHALYPALMEALIEDENAMGEGVADTVQNHKRHYDDDDEDPSARPNQGKKKKRRRTKESESSKKPSTTKETPKGKAPSKGSKTGKSASAKEPVEEPIAEVAMDDAVNTAGEDVDMTPMLWSTINHVYDKDAEKEDQALGRKAVKKLHGYGHLEEVVVKRADRQLYKFKEGDFMDLHLNDIEDMLLLDVQHKLFHLNDSDIVEFIMALCMFTRCLIIKRQVKDLHLGRKWTAIDKKRSELIVELIDKQMRERRIIRNLERL
ncbi:hypothetical protein Tco_0552928, partial [Tanacetum coccineum]